MKPLRNEIMVTETINLKLQGIRIYNDSEIHLGVILSKLSEETNTITKGLEELGWENTGSRFKGEGNEYETAVFSKKHYPIRESISVTCTGNCSGLVTSHNYPLDNKVEGRRVIPSTIVSSNSTPLNCLITEKSIECTIPSPEMHTDPSGRIAPRYRYFSIRESDDFDGDIFVDDQILTDSEDTITDYWAWVRYTPDSDGRGFKKNELRKLKEIISKVITDRL